MSFVGFLREHTGAPLPDYAALHEFSVRELRRFWGLFLRWSGLVVHGAAEPVCTSDDVETARFFPNLRLSYAENLLRGAADDPVLTTLGESGVTRRWRRGELRAAVLGTAAALRSWGLGPGDRVAGIVKNDADALIACLACLALGATWSAVTPELGPVALRERLGPLTPRLLLVHDEATHHGQRRATAPLIDALLADLPSVERVVVLDREGLPQAPPLALEELPRLPFDHPLFVLFTSGTTGPPKCLVHGAGGTLLTHHKEHRLHAALGPGDRLLFVTSCGWMMWNWQLSALATGAEIVLHDGSVSYPEPDALWRRVADAGVTVLGTSPTYLAYCREADLRPREHHDLSRLRLLLSTGSVLPDDLYPYAAAQVAPVPLLSISGGTDILGCFVLGEVALGMDVRAADPDSDGVGELTCAAPFPSRPVGLLGDADGARLHEAYFSQRPGQWSHGDFIRLGPGKAARVLGRCDGVMNIRGIRIGPAELYRALAEVREVREALAVEQAVAQDPQSLGGSRLVLLVVLREGLTLDRALTLRIKKELSQRCSMAHVPGLIAQVAELPTTHSGKRSERAAADALSGRPVRNRSALHNPACLEAIVQQVEAVDRAGGGGGAVTRGA